MPRLRAFTLGFFLLGFELLVFRGLDIIYFKNFWLLMPLILFGSALGSACGYFFNGKSAPDWWLLLAATGAAGFFYWCQVFIGTDIVAAGILVLALVTTFAWGLSNVQTYSSGELLLISALGSAGGILGSGTTLLLNFISYPQTVWAFLSVTFALAALGAWRSRALWFFAAGLVGLNFIHFEYLDPDRDAPALAYYGNSFAQLKVQNFDRLERTGSGTEGFIQSSTEAAPQVFSIVRNHAEATLIFDVLDLKLFPELKLEPSYALLDLGKKEDIAIVGSGGGQEIVQAQDLGYKNITAIEINPDMIRASLEHSRNPQLGYGGSGVTIVNQDARFYFRHLPPAKKFDTITLSLVRYYGSEGLLTYAENYIFTREAFTDYMNHLKPSGLMIVRNSMAENSNGSVYSSIQAAAKGRGKLVHLAISGKDHYIIRKKGWLVEVFAPGGFSPAQRVALRQMDDSKTRPRILDSDDPVATDDKPYLNIWRKRPGEKADLGEHLTPLLFQGPLVLLALFLIAGRTLSAGTSRALTFAALSGLAYFSMQSIFLEKVTLLTGLPTASLLVVLNLFLSGGAVGSLLARRRDLAQKLPLILFALMVSTIGAYLSLRSIDTLSLSASWILACAGLALAPMTVLAGLSFAVFFKRAGTENPRLIPMILAINGAGALIAGIETKGLAMMFGFNAALAVILAFYLAMIALVRSLPLIRS